MTILSRIIATDRCRSLFNTYTVFIHIAIILLLGIACYANSLDVSLILDDFSIVRFSNDTSSNLLNIQSIINRSRWFADITFFLNRQLHGEAVLGYHLMNLTIHLSTASVIYLLANRAIEALKQSFQISGDDEHSAFLQKFIPLTAAVLFVSHPVQTQAVTYISQRYTSLATLLYACSLLSFLKARLTFENETKKLPVYSWVGAFIFFALLAMKSKEIAFTLPLMATALEVSLFRGKLLKNRIFIVIGIGLLLVIPLQQIYMHSAGNPNNLFSPIQSAMTETSNISRSEYMLTQFRVTATYLRLLVLPINQNLDYDYPISHSLFNPSVIAALLLHITLATLALTLFTRSKRAFISVTPSTGIPLRLASLGIFWFYLALSVESSLIPINDVIFEHRIYLPSVGFFMAAAACIAILATYRQQYRNAIWVLIILLSFALMSCTIARNKYWSDELDLWQDVLVKSPNKARPRFAVGSIYYRKLMPEKALPYLVRALELDSSQKSYWITLNHVIMQLGIYNGRCSDGKEFVISDSIDPANRVPWLAISYNNLGLAYEHSGNIYLAQENYKKAVAFNPALDLAWYNLALVSARRNDASTFSNSLKMLRAISPVLEQNAVKAIQEQNSVQLIPQ